MKKAILDRIAGDAEGTVGILTFDDQAVKTLELPWRDNIKQLSCIPEGTYSLHWRRSPSKGWCYHFDLVPGRANILIHAANFAGSVPDGYQSELLGCIAPASRFGLMKNKFGKMQFAGLASRPALNKFEAWGAKEPITLEIVS